MDFGDYTNRYTHAKKQFNVLALVGNGFDIQALQDLGVSGDTRYESFYYFLKMRKFDKRKSNEKNCIFQVIEEEKRRGARNWSDIETAIERLVNGETEYCLNDKGDINFKQIKESLSEIQSEFAEFLNQLVTPKILNDLGRLARGGGGG